MPETMSDHELPTQAMKGEGGTAKQSPGGGTFLNSSLTQLFLSYNIVMV